MDKHDFTIFDLIVKWFALDRKGHVGVFSSGGVGAIPDCSRGFEERRVELYNYFKAFSSRTEFIENPDLDIFLMGRPGAVKIKLLARFGWVAERGLYVFDVCDPREPPSTYFKILSPKDALKKEELPDDIQRRLEGEVLPFEDFKDVDEIIPDLDAGVFKKGKGFGGESPRLFRAHTDQNIQVKGAIKRLPER